MGRLCLEGYEHRCSFSPLSNSVMVPTLDFDLNGIFLGVGSVPQIVSQSISKIFPEGFRLWTGSGPPVYCRVLTIFFWKLGIEAESDSASRSLNHLVGTLLLVPNYCREVRQCNKWVCLW